MKILRNILCSALILGASALGLGLLAMEKLLGGSVKKDFTVGKRKEPQNEHHRCERLKKEGLK